MSTTCTYPTRRRSARRVERAQAQLDRLRAEVEAQEAAKFTAWIASLEDRLAAGDLLTATEQFAVFGRRALRSFGAVAVGALSELGIATGGER